MGDENTIGQKTVYDNIVNQIAQENLLTHNRLTWVLQINGFLFAALALIKIDTPLNIKIFASYVLPIVGIVISLAGYWGVKAAHAQKEYLKSLWVELRLNDFVRPFGVDKTKHFGRLTSLAIPGVLIFSWGLLLLISCISGVSSK